VSRRGPSTFVKDDVLDERVSAPAQLYSGVDAKVLALFLERSRRFFALGYDSLYSLGLSS
jgi:hypothetical protein